MGLADWG
jgi:hypothetical protein